MIFSFALTKFHKQLQNYDNTKNIKGWKMKTTLALILIVQVITSHIRTFQSRFFLPISDGAMKKSTSISPKEEIRLLKAELDDVVMYYRYKENDPFWESEGKRKPIQKVSDQIGTLEREIIG